MADITAIILTKNEEKNIKRCIESITGLCSRIVVMDSYSNDQTCNIAESLGAEIYKHEFVNYGAQFQYALDTVGIQTQWVFRIDADESLTEESYEEIRSLTKIHSNTDVNGIIFCLDVTFLGKQLHHGGLVPFKKLCIFKFNKAYMECRYMDEQIVLTEGRTVEMKTRARHDDYKNLTYWINKQNWYASRAAKDYLEMDDITENIKSLDFPSKVNRFVKYKIYRHLPSRFRCWLYFVYRYYIRLGFLDGREGFYFAFFQAYWYRQLIDAKVFESRQMGKAIGETGSL